MSNKYAQIVIRKRLLSYFTYYLIKPYPRS